MFDLSTYPKYLTFFDLDNAKVIGQMKVQSKGKINDEFVR